MLTNFFNNYFGFNRQQRNGLWVLLVISFTLLVIRIAYPYFIVPANIEVKNLPLVERRMDSAAQWASHSFKKKYKQKEVKQTLFVFNPNTVTEEQLLQLGLREKTAATFIKFRSRGAVFKQKKDLLKVYGISDKLYEALEPYILIEAAKPMLAETKTIQPKVETLQPAAHTKAQVELNSADSAALVALNGIGAGYARRILKYRSLLGGFVAAEQLREVYGFTDELYESIKPFVLANAALVKKINLNNDDFKTINRHPYLGYELTKSIFNWRRKTEINATNLKEILNDGELYRKLLPYLTFD